MCTWQKDWDTGECVYESERVSAIVFVKERERQKSLRWAKKWREGERDSSRERGESKIVGNSWRWWFKSEHDTWLLQYIMTTTSTAKRGQNQNFNLELNKNRIKPNLTDNNQKHFSVDKTRHSYCMNQGFFWWKEQNYYFRSFSKTF